MDIQYISEYNARQNSLEVLPQLHLVLMPMGTFVVCVYNLVWLVFLYKPCVVVWSHWKIHWAVMLFLLFVSHHNCIPMHDITGLCIGKQFIHLFIQKHDHCVVALLSSFLVYSSVLFFWLAGSFFYMLELFYVTTADMKRLVIFALLIRQEFYILPHVVHTVCLFLIYLIVHRSSDGLESNPGCISVCYPGLGSSSTMTLTRWKHYQ